MAGKRLVDQKRLRAKKRKRFLFIWLYVVFFVSLITCGVSLISSIGFFQIRDITISGTDRESPIRIESMVRESLSGTYIWLFPRTNILIYPNDRIEENILSLPLVLSVDVSRKGFSALNVEIVEKVEVARWCDGSDVCYSVDENGFVFSTVASSSAFMYQGLLKDNPIGQTILSKEKFKNIEFFVRELRNMELVPIQALFSANGYLDIVLFGGGRLIIYTEDDLSSVLSTLESVVGDKKVVPSIASFLSTLDYLRLDTGNKVTYKKK